MLSDCTGHEKHAQTRSNAQILRGYDIVSPKRACIVFRSSVSIVDLPFGQKTMNK
jgi:hypothetical protein